MPSAAEVDANNASPADADSNQIEVYGAAHSALFALYAFSVDLNFVLDAERKLSLVIWCEKAKKRSNGS